MSRNLSLARIDERVDFIQQTLYKDVPDDNHYYPTCHSLSKETLSLRLKTMGEPKEFINFSSASYYNLGHHPRVFKAYTEALERYGCGAGGSFLFSGYYKTHEDLERELADFHGGPEAVLFSTGYNANLSAHASFLSPTDMLLIDESSHGSAFDGATLSRTNVRSFNHNDPASLRKHLQRFRHQAEVVVVSTCGIFTMGSEIAPLAELVKCAKEYDALVLLDDAHGVGVLGETGRGSVEHFGLEPSDVDILVSAMSKALGGFGGYVVTSPQLARVLRFAARSHVLSTALPPAAAAGGLAALQILREEGPVLSATLRGKVEQFRGLMLDRGIKPRGQTTGVVSIDVPSQQALWKAMDEMLANGVFCNPVMYPALRANEARMRFHLNINHTTEQLERAADVTRQALENASNVADTASEE